MDWTCSKPKEPVELEPIWELNGTPVPQCPGDLALMPEELTVPADNRPTGMYGGGYLPGDVYRTEDGPLVIVSRRVNDDVTVWSTYDWRPRRMAASSLSVKLKDNGCVRIAECLYKERREYCLLARIHGHKGMMNPTYEFPACMLRTYATSIQFAQT